MDGNKVWLDGNAPPEFQVDSPSQMEWDKSQRNVIDAPAEDRLLIAAGPGTGKTAVACARVAQLIDQGGLEASQIWLISFTRTAVREIRDRIAAYLEDTAAAHAVKLATLDSHSWSIQSGFDDEAKILGTYEENIERVLDLVQNDESVINYLLNSIQHLVVDEAQDIVGIRADLILEMIRKLSTSCGVTLFADEAQAIYGFADDREVRSGEVREPILPEKVRMSSAGDFQEYELTEIHRTHSAQLLRIFSDTRRKVLTAANETGQKLSEIEDEVIRLAHGEAPRVDNAALSELEDTFILYRRRCDVLLSASILTQNGIPHRVRMSGLPVCIMPWVGVMLFDHTFADLTRDRFMDLWIDRVHGTSFELCEPEDAWEQLVRIAGRTQDVVNVRLMRQRLGRRQPPAEFCHAELGLGGPIVGTIHASKGREAETVHLMLSNASRKDIDQDEEARVVFVGATRGRSKLLTGRSWRQFAKRVDASGRAYCVKSKNKWSRAQFEIGHDNDIEAEGLVGRRFFSSDSTALTSQTRICKFGDEPSSLVAECDRSAEFRYRLREDGHEQCIAVLSKSVNSDLFEIAMAIQMQNGGGTRLPPKRFRHLHVRGIRTVVLPPDSPEAEVLHEPWRESGIMLAPVVLGYTTAFFPFKYGQRR